MTDASRHVTWATILGSPGIRKLTRGFSLFARAGRALPRRDRRCATLTVVGERFAPRPHSTLWRQARPVRLPMSAPYDS